MRPILISVGSFQLESHGAAVTLAFLAAGLYALAQRKEGRLAPEQAWTLGLVMALAGLLGAKLGALAFHPVEASPEAGLLARLAARTGAFYPGFWAAVLAGYAYCRRAGLDAARLGDIGAPAMAFAPAIIRVGCFLTGCCHGLPTDLPWGMSFSSPWCAVPGPLRGVPLHPIQLYELAGGLAMAGLLYGALRRSRDDPHAVPGRLFWSYVLGYAALRLATDHLRGTGPRQFDWLLSTGQWCAAFSAAAALVFWPRRRA